MMQNYNSIFLILGLFALIGMSIQVVNAEEMEQNISPKKQLAVGSGIHEIQCKDNYELILKSSDLFPACCKSSSVDKLIQRGWALDLDTMHDKMLDSLISQMDETTVENMELLPKAKEMMKEAAENPISISENMDEMMDDDASNEIKVLKTGEFKGADFFHNAKGQAKIIKTGDQTFLRFEMFEVTNGPDLRVYLTSGGDVKNGIHLDNLKGSQGDQNYLLENVDVESFDTVVIYCQPFGVYFGQAELSMTS